MKSFRKALGIIDKSDNDGAAESEIEIMMRTLTVNTTASTRIVVSISSNEKKIQNEINKGASPISTACKNEILSA
ncbi:MAG TPA: hypothetical protein ENI29_05745 [bacterium]|nr:hypothetical protein [bacterium]